MKRFEPSSLQLCADGKQLLDSLQTPVSSGSSNSITAKADYTDGAAHVLDVVHEVWSKAAFLFLYSMCRKDVSYLVSMVPSLGYTLYPSHTAIYLIP